MLFFLSTALEAFHPSKRAEKFSSVAGVIEAKKDLDDIVEYLKNPSLHV